MSEDDQKEIAKAILSLYQAINQLAAMHAMEWKPGDRTQKDPLQYIEGKPIGQ